MTLHYQRPYMANYKEVAGTGLAPGAKWRVKFNSSSRRLSRAWYIGGDSNIQRAFDTLRQFCRAFKEDHKEAAQKVLGADVADKVFEDWWKSLRSAGLDGTAATAPSCSAILRASMQTVLVAVDGLCVGAKFRSKVAIFEIASEQAEWRIRKITYRDQHYTDLLLADGDACFTTSLGAPRR